jgi:hypothetical protein
MCNRVEERGFDVEGVLGEAGKGVRAGVESVI